MKLGQSGAAMGPVCNLPRPAASTRFYSGQSKSTAELV